MPEPPDTLDLEEPRLNAGKIGEMTGLSYRQINDWDARGALPNERDSVGGWRRLTIWQAMALRIVADLRDQFGIPVNQQRSLLHWMLGTQPSLREVIRPSQAEDLLFGFTEAEKEESNKSFNNLLNKKSLKVVKVGKDPIPIPTQDQKAKLRNRMVEQSVTRMIERGWEREQALDFCQRFYELSLTPPFGSSLKFILPLLNKAVSVGDLNAMSATHRLACAILPLFEAFSAAHAQQPVFLVTNLKTNMFLDEGQLTEVQSSLASKSPCIVYRVNQAINVILEGSGKEPFPIPAPASGALLSANESTFLEMLRKGDFHTLTIRPKGGGYIVYRDRDLDPRTVKSIEELIASKDFHTVSVTTRHGDQYRITERETKLLASEPDKRNKSAPGPGRS